MALSSAALPAACTGVDPCTDIACQQAIAQTHEITEQDFQSRIILSAGPPKELSAAEIQGIIDGGLCGTDALLLDPRVPVNAALNPVTGPYNPAVVAYSLPLFKGILSENAERFSFYVATGGSKGRDVIFAVASGGAVDRYFDFSDLWPSREEQDQ